MNTSDAKKLSARLLELAATRTDLSLFQDQGHVIFRQIGVNGQITSAYGAFLMRFCDDKDKCILRNAINVSFPSPPDVMQNDCGCKVAGMGFNALSDSWETDAVFKVAADALA